MSWKEMNLRKPRTALETAFHSMFEHIGLEPWRAWNPDSVHGCPHVQVRVRGVMGQTLELEVPN